MWLWQIGIICISSARTIKSGKKPRKGVLKMTNFQENIVPAENQNSGNVFLHINGGIKILFAGNSITKHEPKPSIGWNRDCGMAASCAEKDYVHLIVERLKKYDPRLSYGIAQVAAFERGFFNKTPDMLYSAAREFDPDIIVMFFGANVSKDFDNMQNPPKKFGEAYAELRRYLDKSGKARVFHSEGFYIRPVLDAEKEKAAAESGDVFIRIDDIRTREDTHGAFNHPGDTGMQAIADRFLEYLEPAVKKLTEK